MEVIQTNPNEKDQKFNKAIKRPKKKRIKLLRPSQILNKQRNTITLGGPIGKSIGRLEYGSKIFITGRSYSGKSSLIIMLCREVSHYMEILYNNHEEKGGDASTVEQKLNQAGIDGGFDHSIKFCKAPLESDEYETFADLLNKRGKYGFAVLDSIQHAGMDKAAYIDFTNRFCNPKKGKIVAFISHWQKNDFVKHVLHDCDVKLEAMNYVVYVESRMPGATNEPIVIWEEGAKKAWGKRYNDVIKGKYWPGRKNTK